MKSILLSGQTTSCYCCCCSTQRARACSPGPVLLVSAIVKRKQSGCLSYDLTPVYRIHMCAECGVVAQHRRVKTVARVRLFSCMHLHVSPRDGLVPFSLSFCLFAYTAATRSPSRNRIQGCLAITQWRLVEDSSTTMRKGTAWTAAEPAAPTLWSDTWRQGAPSPPR